MKIHNIWIKSGHYINIKSNWCIFTAFGITLYYQLLSWGKVYHTCDLPHPMNLI